jgi:hypothetical protein
MTLPLPALLSLIAIAQTDTLPQREAPWSLTERLGMNEEVAGEIEAIEWRRDHPLDLNKATRDELLTLPFLSQAEVDSLLLWRKTSRGFNEADELATHGQLGANLLRLIGPFVVVSPRAGRLLGTRFRRDWEGAGLSSSGWLVSRPIAGWEIGLKMREVRARGDFSREWHGGIMNSGAWGSAYAGDIRIWSGEGLVFGQTSVQEQGFSLDLDRRQEGISLSTSSLSVMRGVGLAFKGGGEEAVWNLALVTSFQHMPGVRLPGTLSRPEELGSGFSPAVIKGGAERLWGGTVSLRVPWGLHVGISAFDMTLKNFLSEAEAVPTRNAWAAGADCRFQTGAFDLSAAAAWNRGGGHAWGLHAILQINPEVECGFGGRWYSTDYWNPHAVGIDADGDSRGAQSTWGVLNVDPVTWMHCTLSLRRTSRSNFETGYPLNVNQVTYALLVDADLRKNIRGIFSVRSGTMESPSSGSDTLGRQTRTVTTQNLTRLRVAIMHHAGSGVQGGVKCEWVTDPTAHVQGIAGAVFFGWSAGRLCELNATLTLHEADDGGPVFWITENLHPGSTDLVGLYGAGSRLSGYVRLRPFDGLHISLALIRSLRQDTSPPAAQWKASIQVGLLL